MKTVRHAALLLFLTVTCTGLAADGDWPTWRCDASRTGASGSLLPDELSLLWHRNMGYPDAAFIHQMRMCADAAYAPVAADGLVFVPSNLRDEVSALDLATGETVWRYVAEGPVRYAPVVHNGKLYFGSDDGQLYCLEASTGKLLWIVRGVPNHLPNSKMLINGRYCSRWPVRGAPVLLRDKLFFGAGIWPEEGVYVSAIDTETGEVLWRTDALSLQQGGMNDHNNQYDLGLPPHGYLAIINGKLAVPSGRSLALFLDPETGEAEPYNCYYSKNNPPRGTWWLAGNSKYWIQAGNVFSTTSIDFESLPPEEMDLDTFATYVGETPARTLATLEELRRRYSGGRWRPISGLTRQVEVIKKDGQTIIKAPLRSQQASGTFSPKSPSPDELFNYKNRPFLNADVFKVHDEVFYTEPVLSGNILYNSILDDPSKYLYGRGETFVHYPSFDRIVARDMSKARWKISLSADHLVRRLEFPVEWELATPHKVLIASGDKVVAGRPGEIITIKPPAEAGEAPTISFQAKIDGAPVNALVSHGKLIVSTNTGKLYCFGTGEASSVPDRPVQRASVFGKPHAPSFPQGYALVLGWGSGKHPERLLKDGRHQIVVLETDKELADRQRQALAAKGLYGRQIQIVTANSERLLLSKYWANLVISEDLTPFSASLLAAALETVRPFSGRLYVPATDKSGPLLKEVVAAQPEFTSRAAGSQLEFHRTSPPRGYDDWTHETAGPGNTFANRDALVKAPLGLLWFSGYIDRFYTPEFHFQHFRAPYPLISHGRMFLITGKYMNAVDVYTGNFLWKIEMPMTERVKWRYMDSRVYSRPYERNYVATPDTLYIIYEQEIHLICTATGENLGVFTIPEEIDSVSNASVWTEVRLAGDYLCCVVGNTLACLDRKTGKLVWQRKSTLDGTTYALGDTSLYGVDYIPPPNIFRGETASRKESILFRLDLKTGTESWTTSVEHTTVPDQNPKQKKPWLLPIVPAIIFNAKHQKAVVVVNRMSYHAFNAGDGKKAWEYLGDYSAGDHTLHLAPMPLVADDIVFGSTADYKSMAVVLDVRTGKVIDNGSWLNYKRGCSRVIGNRNLLTYRNAATEVFDYQTKTRLNFNSVRAGCTANFIPAGGVLNAPSFGHGCVCNYPTFASLAMVNLPEADAFKPAIIKASEMERSKFAPEGQSEPAAKTITLTDKEMNVSSFGLIDAELKTAKGGCVFSTAGEGNGFAVMKAPEGLTRGTLTCAFKAHSGKGRHKNSFLVFGSSAAPEDLIKVMLYHGGRKRIIISGKHVDERQDVFELPKNALTEATVHVDLPARTVCVNVAGKTLTAKITGNIPAITHYGYGGSNSDTFFTEIVVNDEGADPH